MLCISLVSFVKNNETFRDDIKNPEQIASVENWAETIEPMYQEGYLECLMEFRGKRLQTYLKNLIPGYPQNNE